MNRPPSSILELRTALREAGCGKTYAITARYDGACGRCEQAILKGDIVAWLPDEKTILCAGCAVEPEP